MEKAPVDLVSPDWVDSLITATLGGAPPAAVAALVDRDVCARMIDSSKLGASFRLGGDESPDVWVADRGEVERVRAAAIAQWPAVKAFVDKRAKLDQVFCTQGKGLRVFAIERDNVAGPGGHPVLAWEWNDGVEATITRHDGAPLTLLSGDLLARTKAFAARLEGGLWGVRWQGGAAVSVNWTSEGMSSPAIAAAFVELGHGTRFKTAYQVYATAGLTVHPWFAELDADGGGRVCMWGAHRMQDTSNLPDLFANGAVPDAAAFAAELATVVGPADQAAAVALVRDELVPLFIRLRPAGTDAGRHLAEVWTWLVGLLGLELPAGRLAILQQVTVAARLAALQGDAFHLAAARYVVSHPDAAPPADLPSSLVGVSADAIVAQATALRATFDTLEKAAVADPEFDLHRYPSAAFDLPTIKELLDRAIGGEFQAASGPLHDYLQSLGRLGYDDDPTLITIDSVDLDSKDQDAVLEEALAAKADDKA